MFIEIAKNNYINVDDIRWLYPIDGEETFSVITKNGDKYTLPEVQAKVLVHWFKTEHLGVGVLSLKDYENDLPLSLRSVEITLDDLG